MCKIVRYHGYNFFKFKNFIFCVFYIVKFVNIFDKICIFKITMYLNLKIYI